MMLMQHHIRELSGAVPVLVPWGGLCQSGSPGSLLLLSQSAAPQLNIVSMESTTVLPLLVRCCGSQVFEAAPQEVRGAQAKRASVEYFLVSPYEHLVGLVVLHCSKGIAHEWYYWPG
jgi:hypothetical protein